MPLPADQRTIARPAQRRELLQHGGRQVAPRRCREGPLGGRSGLSPARRPASQAIKALSERPNDRPFFFWVASKDPHRPFDENAIGEPS